MSESEVAEINAAVAKDMGGGYIKMLVVIDNKTVVYKLRKSVAVSVIKTLVESLDDNLRSE